MFEIISREVIAPGIKRIKISAPDIARHAKPGQFVILRVSDNGERIPLTAADRDPENGTITLIFQEIGKTTRALGCLEPGARVADILGPLGTPTEAVRGLTIAAIGGGVGAAEILPVSRMYKEAGNRVVGIIGARNRGLVILEKEMTAVCDKVIISTDDGSYGRKGFVTDALKSLLEKEHIDLVYAIGPVPMMRAVSDLTKDRGIRTIVALNPVMVDGTGLCGSCRVTIGGETRFACVDGPEFDGHLVAWDELAARLRAFSHKERAADTDHPKGCACERPK